MYLDYGALVEARARQEASFNSSSRAATHRPDSQAPLVVFQ